MDTDTTTTSGTTVSLKEWGAAIHALLLGRQQILLRKGGIHEKAFATSDGSSRYLLFPTVAHTHAERTRPEHHDLLAAGDRDAQEDWLTFRAGAATVDVVPVARPERLPELSDLHIWTDESITTDRVEFRPKHPLQILVVQAIALAEPVRLRRRPTYGGCTSWIDVEHRWNGEGSAVGDLDTLRVVADRVRATVG